MADMSLFRPALVPLVLSLLLAGTCYAMTGGSLGVYLAGFGVVAILLPALALAERDWLRRLIAGGSAIDAVAVVWLVAVLRTETTFVQWIWLYLLLAAFGLALWGLATALARTGLGDVLAAALTMLLGSAWLSWPVWLSPWLSGEAGAALAQRLVAVHPPLVANGMVRHLGVWTEHAVLYGLTALGQDISYRLPGNIAAALLLHGVLALVLGIAAHIRR